MKKFGQPSLLEGIEPISSEENAVDQANNADERERLELALKTMEEEGGSSSEAAYVIRRHLEGASLEQVSRETGKSKPKVERKMFDALVILQRIMGAKTPKMGRRERQAQWR